jgi:hypothetical protein
MARHTAAALQAGETGTTVTPVDRAADFEGTR